MENKLPNSFVAFITAIVEAETETDLWKSKLFYLPVQEVYALLGNNNEGNHLSSESGQDGEEQGHVNLQQILMFIEQSSGEALSRQQEKVIQKYFYFTEQLQCSQQCFMKRLKPINNKLILTIDREQVSTEECLKGLFKSILSGYEKINPLRQQCGSNFKQILSYFRSRQLQKSSLMCLTKESLKQLMFQANIYGRVNFLYAKDYIFGEKNREEIEWAVLFGIELIQTIQQIQLENSSRVSRKTQENQTSAFIQKIDQLQEQHITTDKVIPRPHQISITHSNEQQYQQQEYRERIKSIEVEQEKKAEEKRLEDIQREVREQEQNDENYRKNLSQINHIQELLNKTKERYQKNKQLLQNQTNLIKNQQLKRNQSKGKYNYTSIIKNNQQSLLQTITVTHSSQTQTPNQQSHFNTNQNNTKKQKLINSVEEQVSIIHKFDQSQGSSYPSKNITQPTNTPKISKLSPKNALYLSNSPKLDNYLKEKPYVTKMDQSLVKPFITRQTIKKQIETYQQKTYNSPYQQRSIVNPYIQNIRNNAHQQSFINNITTSSNRNDSSQRRQIGKIKRRSTSKDQISQTNIDPKRTPSFTQTNSLQQSNNDSSNQQTTHSTLQQKSDFSLTKKTYNYTNSDTTTTEIFKPNNTNTYHQYEAVLKEIKREQNQYKKILETREKILLDKQSKKKRLTLQLNPNQSSTENTNLQKRYTPINSLMEAPASSFKTTPNNYLLETQTESVKKQPTTRKVYASIQKRQQAKRESAKYQKPTISNSRYEQIMREIEANSLAKSRVSSKKREEIVQKATSEARLRIQQIQSRALKRLGKAESSEKLNTMRKNLVQDNSSLLEREYDIPKYRKNMQSSLHLGTKINQNTSPKNYSFINGMLNERPTGLRITGNYRQKY